MLKYGPGFTVHAISPERDSQMCRPYRFQLQLGGSNFHAFETWAETVRYLENRGLEVPNTPVETTKNISGAFYKEYVDPERYEFLREYSFSEKSPYVRCCILSNGRFVEAIRRVVHSVGHVVISTPWSGEETRTFSAEYGAAHAA